MIDRLRQLTNSHSARPLRLGAVLVVVAVFGMFVAARPAHALTVTQVTPCSISTTEASICWATDSAADGVIQFGTSQTALNSKVANTVQFETDHKLPIGPLRAGTRYYYQVASKDQSGATAQSTVAFFDSARLGSGTTGSAAAQLAAAAPAFFDVSIAASSTAGILYFSTIPETSTSISVAAMPGFTYTGPSTYTTVNNAADCPNGGCQYRVVFSGLSADAQFTFSITATAIDGSSATYGPQQFGSGSGPDDWKVATGSCSDGTAIGSCSGVKYCNNGQLVDYCGRCGYQCPNGLTCRVGGVCTSDVVVGDSNLQCNDASCYDTLGAFKSPAPIGCNSAWTRCNANVVLKVKKDRVCNQWQTCESSLESTSAQTGQKENLCLAVANCAAVDDKGNCSLFLPKGQCENDPLRFCSTNTDCQQKPDGTSYYACLNGTDQALAISYESPTQISKIQNLSGNVQAGLTFNGNKVSDSVSPLSGNFPYSNFQQVGDSFNLANGDFEQTRRETVRNKDGSVSTVTNYHSSPWEAVGAKGTDGVTEPAVSVVLESPQDKNNSNHVLEIRPTDKSNADYTPDTSGARAPADGSFNVTVLTEYHVRLRIKSGPFTKTAPTVIMFFNGQPRYDSLSLSQATQTRGVTLTSDWQVIDFRVPVLGQRYLEIDRLNGEAVPFYVDDVSIQPVLKIAPDQYVGRSCRLFPRSDSLICDYTDSNGVRFSGWHGFCVQHDPQKPNICLSWWPVDLIRGDDAFQTFSTEHSQAYNDRTPLYFCMESKGYLSGFTYKIDTNNEQVVAVDSECTNDATDAAPSGNWSFKACAKNGGEKCWTPTNNSSFISTTCPYLPGNGSMPYLQNLHDYDLASIELVRANGRGEYSSDFVMSTSSSYVNEDASATYAAVGDIIYEFDNQKVLESGNKLIFRAVFDKTTRLLKHYYVTVDDLAVDSEPAYYHIVFHQRDICTKLVKVADDSGESKPWTNRVARSSNYKVPDLNYSYTSDFAPFGAIINPAGDPETWNGLAQANSAVRYPLYIELADTDNTDLRTPFQVRASSPYACNGFCQKQQCITNAVVGNQCTTDGSCSQSSNDLTASSIGVCEGAPSSGASWQGSQLFTSERVCVSSANELAVKDSSGKNISCPDNPCPANSYCPNNATFVKDTFAARRLQRLFTKSFGFWTLGDNGEYVRDTSSLPWSPPTTECPNGTRPAYDDSSPTDYCSVRPILSNVGWVQAGQTLTGTNNSSIVLDGRRGGVVKVKFNVNIDPEQAPLRSIVINWRAEEGSNSKDIDTLDLSSPPRSDPNNPYIFFHQYGPSTTSATSHTIAISVRDNWDWCNGSSGQCPPPPVATQDTLETLQVTYQ